MALPLIENYLPSQLCKVCLYSATNMHTGPTASLQLLYWKWHRKKSSCLAFIAHAEARQCMFRRGTVKSFGACGILKGKKLRIPVWWARFDEGLSDAATASIRTCASVSDQHPLSTCRDGMEEQVTITSNVQRAGSSAVHSIWQQFYNN